MRQVAQHSLVRVQPVLDNYYFLKGFSWCTLSVPMELGTAQKTGYSVYSFFLTFAVRSTSGVGAFNLFSSFLCLC